MYNWNQYTLHERNNMEFNLRNKKIFITEFFFDLYIAVKDFGVSIKCFLLSLQFLIAFEYSA